MKGKVGKVGFAGYEPSTISSRFQIPMQGAGLSSIRSLGFINIHLGPNNIRKTPLRIKNEIVPPWIAETEFLGYPTIYHALAVSRTRTNVCVIARTGAHSFVSAGEHHGSLGYFRVFETRLSPLASGIIVSTPYEYPLNVVQIRLVNLYRNRTSCSWDELSKEYIAAESTDDRSRVTGKILTNCIGLNPEEFNLFTGAEMRHFYLYHSRPEWIKRLSTTRLNFDPFYPNNGDTLAFVTTTGFSSFSRRLELQQSPSVAMVLNNSFFQKRRPSIAFLFGTLCHESFHALAFRRIAGLIHSWRLSVGSQETKKTDFVSWFVSNITVDSPRGRVDNARVVPPDVVPFFSSIRRDDQAAIDEIELVGKSKHDIDRKIGAIEKISADEKVVALEWIRRWSLQTAGYNQLHAYSHLESFLIKIWLDRETIVKQAGIYKHKGNLANFPYFSDLIRVRDYLKAYAFSSDLVGDIQQNVIEIIVQALVALGPHHVQLVKDYIVDSIGETVNSQSSPDLFSMLKLALDEQ